MTTRSFTFGATFRPRVNLRPETTRTIVAKDVFIDTVDYKISRSDYYLPSTFTAGLYYQTRKVGMGLDYTFEKWKGINQSDLIDGIRYRNNNFIKVGMRLRRTRRMCGGISTVVPTASVSGTTATT